MKGEDEEEIGEKRINTNEKTGVREQIFTQATTVNRETLGRGG